MPGIQMRTDVRELDEGKAEQQQARTRNFAGDMIRLFGQVMMLPLVTFVYALEAFSTSMREIRNATDQTLETMVGRDIQSLDTTDIQPPVEYASGWGDQTGFVPLNSNVGAVSRSGETISQITQTEEHEMSEQDLRGEDLKLVRWAISFTKRDLEVALEDGVDLVNYSTELGDYKCSKRDEFLRIVRKDGYDRPKKWVDEDYPKDAYLDPNDKDIVRDLPSDDTDKFLRVYVEVLKRYEKDEPNYDKDEVKELRGIRTRLDKGITVRNE